VGEDVPVRGRRLVDLTWPEVAERAGAGAVLAVPVGSTEQHGPHLPLSTDTDVACALADALAGRRDDVLVGPAVGYGSSGEHDGFAGTVSIGREATRLLLVELVRSATRTFARVLLVVGHGGNAAPVTEAVTLLRSQGHDVVAWGPRWDGDAHAGRTETSVQLALDPRRVRVAAAAAGRTDPVAGLMPALLAGGVRAVSPNGVLGDPAGASAAEGRRLLEAAADALDDRVRGWLAEPA
jgi:creatinine amidohydrolase